MFSFFYLRQYFEVQRFQKMETASFFLLLSQKDSFGKLFLPLANEMGEYEGTSGNSEHTLHRGWAFKKRKLYGD